MRAPGFPPRRGPRGFTLLELILALSLSVILAASLFASLHIALKAKESGSVMVRPAAQMETAMEMIRADLEAAQPPNGILEGEFEGTQNGGGDAESDQLTFFNNGLVAGPHQDGVGEIKQVCLLLEQQGSDQVLVRQVLPINPALTQQTSNPDEEIICRNVQSFALQYFDGEEWQTSWDSSQYGNALPAAVAVLLIVHDSENPAKLYRARRVVALSCVAQQTTQSGGASSGSGSGSGSGGNNSGKNSGTGNNSGGKSTGSSPKAGG